MKKSFITSGLDLVGISLCTKVFKVFLMFQGFCQFSITAHIQCLKFTNGRSILHSVDFSAGIVNMFVMYTKRSNAVVAVVVVVVYIVNDTRHPRHREAAATVLCTCVCRDLLSFIKHAHPRCLSLSAFKSSLYSRRTARIFSTRAGLGPTAFTLQVEYTNH